MRRLILCRHGQTAWNKERRIQGLEDIDLDETGFEQAKVLAQMVQNLELRAPRLLSSPLLRALSTARPMAAALGVEIETDADLLEVDTGSYTGKRLSDLRADPAWQAHLTDPWNSCSESFGESASSVRERIVRAINRHCRSDESGGDFIFVTHADLIRHAVMSLLGIPGHHLYQLRISNASLTAFELDAHRVKMLGINWRADFQI